MRGLHWNRKNIAFLLICGAALLINNEGVVNAAAYIFIALAFYIVYKTWSKNL